MAKHGLGRGAGRHPVSTVTAAHIATAAMASHMERMGAAAGLPSRGETSRRMGRLSAHVCRLIDRRMSHGMPGLVVPGILLLAASLVLVAAVVIRARLVPVGFSSLLLATALLLPLLRPHSDVQPTICPHPVTSTRSPTAWPRHDALDATRSSVANGSWDRWPVSVATGTAPAEWTARPSVPRRAVSGQGRRRASRAPRTSRRPCGSAAGASPGCCARGSSRCSR